MYGGGGVRMRVGEILGACLRREFGGLLDVWGGFEMVFM